MTILAVEGAKNFGSKELAQLTADFEGAITDITSTLTTSGYARGLEEEADRAAVQTLTRTGYNPRGLVDMLGVMKTRLKPGGLDFARTHPDPDDRRGDVLPLVADYPEVAPPEVRQARFEQALAR